MWQSVGFCGNLRHLHIICTVVLSVCQKKKHVPRNEKIDIGLKIADFKAIFFTFSKSIIFPKNLNQEEGGNSRLPKIKEDSMPKLKRTVIVR